MIANAYNSKIPIIPFSEVLTLRTALRRNTEISSKTSGVSHFTYIEQDNRQLKRSNTNDRFNSTLGVNLSDWFRAQASKHIDKLIKFEVSHRSSKRPPRPVPRLTFYR